MTIRATTKRINKSRIVMSKYEKQVESIIELGANMVRNTAVKSIQQHGSSGTTYGKHTASAPGKPPNSDTGYLASNIFIQKDADDKGASVESRAEYSAPLEFGTRNMRARPFLQPALEENRKKIIAMYAKLKARGV